jgi:hypothetical protein
VLVPDDTPVTVPVVPTVAVAVLVLLHTPPVVVSTNVVVAPPAHTFSVPVIEAGVVGKGFTETIADAAALPQLLDIK